MKTLFWTVLLTWFTACSVDTEGTNNNDSPTTVTTEREDGEFAEGLFEDGGVERPIRLGEELDRPSEGGVEEDSSLPPITSDDCSQCENPADSLVGLMCASVGCDVGPIQAPTPPQEPEPSICDGCDEPDLVTIAECQKNGCI